MWLSPPPAPDHGQRIREGHTLFGVPCLTAHRARLLRAPTFCHQENQRLQSQHAWGRTGHGFGRPWPLRLHAQMGACFLTGPCHWPAHPAPFHDWPRGGRQPGAEQRWRLKLSFRGTAQHPAHRPRRHAGVRPHARAADGLPRTLTLPIPAAHRDAWPPRRLGGGHRWQRGPAAPVLARPSWLLRLAGRCGLIQGGIQAPACHPGDLSPPSRPECPSGTTALRGAPHVTAWQPARVPQPQLPRTIRQRPVGTSALLIVRLRRTPARQERHGPQAWRPGQRPQQHQRAPVQAPGCDARGMRSPPGMAVNTCGGHLVTASSVAGIIQTSDNVSSG